MALYVEEGNRAWTSSSPENDHQAVTIEVANDEVGGRAVTHSTSTSPAAAQNPASNSHTRRNASLFVSIPPTPL